MMIVNNDNSFSVIFQILWRPVCRRKNGRKCIVYYTSTTRGWSWLCTKVSTSIVRQNFNEYILLSSSLFIYIHNYTRQRNDYENSIWKSKLQARIEWLCYSKRSTSNNKQTFARKYHLSCSDIFFSYRI